MYDLPLILFFSYKTQMALLQNTQRDIDRQTDSETGRSPPTFTNGATPPIWLHFLMEAKAS